MGYSWETACLEDGLEQPGFVAESRGLHCAVDFMFAPVWPEIFEKFEAEKEAVATRNPGDARAMVGQFLAKHIKSWDLKDSAGKLVPITEVTCRKLRAALQFRLYRIICCVAETDLNPAWIMSNASPVRLMEDVKPLEEQIKN